jgi:hypothetical protein
MRELQHVRHRSPFKPVPHIPFQHQLRLRMPIGIRRSDVPRIRRRIRPFEAIPRRPSPPLRPPSLRFWPVHQPAATNAIHE